MNRRSMIERATACAAGAALAACGGAEADGTRKPTVVLVHGAWHGAWCWGPVVQQLAQRGYPAVAVDLPLHGLDARFPAAYLQQPQSPASLATEVSPVASGTLDQYRDAVLAVLRGLQANGAGPVVLVGHSLAGLTLSAVAEAAPSLVRRLVYVAAMVLLPGSTLGQFLGRPSFATARTLGVLAADPAVVGAFRINFASTDPATQAAIKAAFCADVDAAAFTAMGRMLVPDEPAQLAVAPVAVTANAWGGVPRTYVRCSADWVVPPAGADEMIAAADAFAPANRFKVVDIASSHSVFASQPAALTDAIVAHD